MPNSALSSPTAPFGFTSYKDCGKGAMKKFELHIHYSAVNSASWQQWRYPVNRKPDTPTVTEIKGKVAAFIEDRKQANNLVDVIGYLGQYKVSKTNLLQ